MSPVFDSYGNELSFNRMRYSYMCCSGRLSRGYCYRYTQVTNYYLYENPLTYFKKSIYWHVLPDFDARFLSDKDGFFWAVGVGLEVELWRDGERLAFLNLNFSWCLNVFPWDSISFMKNYKDIKHMCKTTGV